MYFNIFEAVSDIHAAYDNACLYMKDIEFMIFFKWFSIDN